MSVGESFVFCLILAALVVVGARLGGAAALRYAFDESCAHTVMAPDDPIVYPRQSGASHMHSFYGPTEIDATTKPAHLRKMPSSCQREPANRSAYWVPTLYRDGVEVQSDRTVIYYFGHGNGDTRLPPRNLVMISDSYVWNCVDEGNGVGTPTPHPCSGNKLRAEIVFPDCSDGRSDSSDHRSHVAFSDVGGVCPPTHPTPIPRISMRVLYADDGSGSYELSAGPSTNMHADWMNGWDPPELQTLIEECLTGDGRAESGPPCGSAGL